ncbi:MAG: DUF4097 family beta strand repeat-containing protein [Balneola sp.]
MRNLFITLFILIPTIILAQSGTKDGEFNASEIDQLHIIVDAGMKINITGSDSDKIQYTYELDGNDQAYDLYFKNFDPKFESTGGRALFRIDFPKNRRKNVNLNTKKHNLVLTVPKEIELYLDTRYSNVNIQSIQRTTEVNNRSGTVYVHKIGQGAVLNNEYGNIRAEEINGDVRITSRSASVDVKSVRGSLTVKSNYTKMNLTKISGELNLENKSGTINAYDLDSKLTARGDYVNFELTNLRGDVDIDTKSGSVSIDKAENVIITGDYTNTSATNIRGSNGIRVSAKSSKVDIKNVTGSASVTGEYINVVLENVDQHIEIRNKSGKIKATGIGGAVLIDGDYNKVDLENYLGNDILVNNRSGNIDVEAQNKLQRIEVNTSYGDLDITLNSSFEGNVDFNLEYGKLKHPYTLNNARFDNGTNYTRVQGTVGKGTGTMLIKARNTDVTINQK